MVVELIAVSDQGLHGLQLVCHLSVGISQSHNLIYIKLKFDFSKKIVWGSLFSLKC